ncbi:15347_t:CDS:10, partial [Entrophospora sp. SA101]
LMAGIKVSSYFINISPEEWKFSEFYKYRQQENDFTSSFRKEAFILRRSLDYLMKEGSSEVKNYATLLDKNFKGHRTNDMDSKLFWDKIELQLDFHAEIEMREREMRLAKVGTATGIMKRIDGALNERFIQTDERVQTKRKKMDQPPHPPPDQIYSLEFSDSNDGRIYKEIYDDNINDNAEEDIYLKSIHLSQETLQNVMEEIRKIVEKIRSIEYRLFDYRIINLSERNVTNPVNKLSKSEKRILKDIWNSLEPSGKVKTIRLNKWENVLQPLIQKYQTHLENKSVFDVISLDGTIENVLEKPYIGTFIHKEHYDLLWIQDIYKRFLFLFNAPTNLLQDPDQNELSYRENFVNPIIVKAFDDIIDLVKVKTRTNRTKLKETKLDNIGNGCSQDGIYSINVNAVILEVGFLEVIGNALYTDVKKLNEDTEKVFKCMQISIYYQRQHYLSCGATEQQVSSIESYGIIVYQRMFTFYVMHQTNGGLRVVDIIKEFSIPSTKDQLYILREVIEIENVYLFKKSESSDAHDPIENRNISDNGLHKKNKPEKNKVLYEEPEPSPHSSSREFTNINSISSVRNFATTLIAPSISSDSLKWHDFLRSKSDDVNDDNLTKIENNSISHKSTTSDIIQQQDDNSGTLLYKHNSHVDSDSDPILNNKKIKSTKIKKDKLKLIGKNNKRKSKALYNCLYSINVTELNSISNNDSNNLPINQATKISTRDIITNSCHEKDYTSTLSIPLPTITTTLLLPPLELLAKNANLSPIKTNSIDDGYCNYSDGDNEIEFVDSPTLKYSRVKNSKNIY